MVSEPRQRSYAAAVSEESDSGDEISSEKNYTAPAAPIHQQQDTNQEGLQNPLYLHVTENPSVILVSPALTENNYSSWSRSMKMALEVKNKFGLVDGSISDPGVGNPLYPQWKRCNAMVCAWILNSLSPTIAESVIYSEVARDIWTDLHDRFSHSDPHRIAELQNEIFNTKQGGMTVNEYYTKCKSLWEKLSTLRPLPMCKCIPKCSCSLVSKIRKEREEDRVIHFLEGLNEEYETVKSGALVMDPIPTIEGVFRMALKLERKLNSFGQNHNGLMQANMTQSNQSHNSEEESMIAAIGSGNFNGKKRYGNGGKTVPKCTYYGMTGHTVDKCYKKHGYPPGWIPGYKNKAKQNPVNQYASNVSSGQAGEVGLSAEQFQKLISLLQPQNQSGQPSSSSTAAVSLNSPQLQHNFKGMTEETSEGRGSILSFMLILLLNLQIIGFWTLEPLITSVAL